ncbi:MAG: NTP transferase domain-containing protein, partial [Candidatus Eremiobacteraeota bacterium]|nr:NTP transferase domain-containing protein [Candidatus Eremiobacteraeota bacterium]
LAAGRGARMGGGAGKLLLPFRYGTMLGAVLDACTGHPTVVVAAPEIADLLASADVVCVVNRQPQRGMTYSLRLANAAISAERPIAILLGDKPLVHPELVTRTVDALSPQFDVVFPQRDGVPGHPVALSARARGFIDDLPDGDTLHMLRDDPRLTRRSIAIDDDGAFVDVDTEADYRRVCAPEAVTAGR